MTLQGHKNHNQSESLFATIETNPLRLQHVNITPQNGAPMDSAMSSTSQTELPEIDAREFEKVVETRRSIRRFTDEPVPDEILNRCLDLAMLAPNSCNLQPWEFYIIKDPAVKKKLVHACLDQNAAKTSQALIAVVARTDTWYKHCDENITAWPDPKLPKIVEDFYSKVAKFQYALGPLGILGLFKKGFYSIVGLTRPVPRGPYSRAEMKEWATKSTALAAQTLMLSLRAHGYDSCPMEGFDEKRVRKILALPSKASVIMFVAAGKRSENGVYNTRYRFDREKFVHII